MKFSVIEKIDNPSNLCFILYLQVYGNYFFVKTLPIVVSL